jgi:hypothetical protein
VGATRDAVCTPALVYQLPKPPELTLGGRVEVVLVLRIGVIPYANGVTYVIVRLQISAADPLQKIQCNERLKKPIGKGKEDHEKYVEVCLEEKQTVARRSFPYPL